MKIFKFVFLLMGVLTSTNVFAQSDTPSDSNTTALNATDITGNRPVYCLIVGKATNLLGLGSKCIVEVDFGEGQSVWRGGIDNTLVDEKGKPIKFNSMVDALNYMTRFGWTFVNAYAITLAPNQHVYHWLLKKDISASESGREGLNQIRDKKKKNTKKQDEKYDPIYN